VPKVFSVSPGRGFVLNDSPQTTARELVQITRLHSNNPGALLGRAADEAIKDAPHRCVPQLKGSDQILRVTRVIVTRVSGDFWVQLAVKGHVQCITGVRDGALPYYKLRKYAI